MGFRDKSIVLLIVFSFSLFPFPVVLAEGAGPRTLDQALTLMYLSEAVMLPDEEIDDSAASLGLHTAARTAYQRSLADPMLARIIHAKKQQRNDLDAAYRLLSAQLRQEGKDCEAARIKEEWQKQRREFNTQIGFYHKVRGDRRKPLTRIWHSLKRAGRGFWQRIGPLGRNFLRRVGPEVLQVVASGGTLSGGLLRKLAKHHFKAVVQERIQQVVYQGVQRLLTGQLTLARAAGVDLCEEEALQEDPSEEKQVSNVEKNPYPDGAEWRCRDVNGVLSTLKARESAAMKTLQSELDFDLTYSADTSSLEVNFGYDVAEEWGVIQTNGSIGDWHVLTMHVQVIEPAVMVDKQGVFRGMLAYDSTYTEYDNTWTTSQVDHFWGLIPPDAYQSAFVCLQGRIPLPEGLETLTADNFQDRCGSYSYYECSLESP